MSFVRFACLALSALGLAGGAAAQAPYPGKAVRLVVPYQSEG
jgi:tripartite-type tricarboxylate transporter receptor subunit TctC